MRQSIFIGSALLIASASYVTLAQPAPSAPVRATVATGVPASEVPVFPPQLARSDLVQKILNVPSDCKGSTPAQTADAIDALVGGRGALGRADAFLNLALTEPALGADATARVIISLGRYPDGLAALAKVSAFAHAIAARQYEVKQQENAALRAQYGAPLEGLLSQSVRPTAQVVIRSLERDVLVAVIESARLAGSPEARTLIEGMAQSPVNDVGQVASSTLNSWQ